MSYQISLSALPPPNMSFDHLQIDFIELTLSEGKMHCAVVMDMFRKWVEAFLVLKADVSAVAKVLVSEIIL